MLILRNQFLVEVFLDRLLTIHFQQDVAKKWGLVAPFPVTQAETITFFIDNFDCGTSGQQRFQILFVIYRNMAILGIGWDVGREIIPILDISNFHSSFQISQLILLLSLFPFLLSRNIYHGFLKALVLNCLKPWLLTILLTDGLPTESTAILQSHMGTRGCPLSYK